MKETIIIIVQRPHGRKRLTVEHAMDGAALDLMESPQEILWWQLQRCRKELDTYETKKINT